MRALLALLVGLLLAGPATAQSEKPLAAADLSGVWQGQWISSRGFLYTTILTLRVGTDGLATGSFAWTLRRSPRPEEQSKLGMSATEYVSGRTNTTARTVTLRGRSPKPSTSARALASPNPRLPPVTIATFPFNADMLEPQDFRRASGVSHRPA